MQKIIFISFLLNACCTLTASPLQAQSPAQAQPVKKIGIAELENYIRQCDHPLIVNFWATYCNPCVKEIPYLQTTAKKFRDSGVELLLVSIDPPADHSRRITAFAERMNIVANLAWLDRANAGDFYPQIDKKWSGGIPASLFINNNTGYRQFFDRQLTDRQVEQQVKILVGPPQSPSGPPVPRPSL